MSKKLEKMYGLKRNTPFVDSDKRNRNCLSRDQVHAIMFETTAAMDRKNLTPEELEDLNIYVESLVNNEDLHIETYSEDNSP